MALRAPSDTREKIGAGAAVALVHGLVGLALIWGLGVPATRVVERSLDVFDVTLPPPEAEPVPPPPPRRVEPSPQQRQSPGREGAASPPNLHSEATQIVAPPPVVRLPVPPPITAAPVSGQGSDPSQGAADVRGPGFGAGGDGDGRGAGGDGDGEGGGGMPPRHLRGRMTDADYPRAALEIGAGGTVSVRFTVALNGRAVNCRIVESSGNRDLDANTCRLIERRYRFAPSRDWRGRPVLADVVEDHSWVARPREGW
ncbi:energy transducer TonB [Sphingosinicella sp. LHD-64]|uniref:energy transducer TonB n=1 Tax=Sphingosinicella sp. LHD-64 TaxID=3072139 RepID=UPI00280F7AC3|nr:energy transducer TonB [Sphingosinicella sp. LHD-64]MDQ8756804.1 energy transducer TonB [Sphingosinicella sp. LHD-64]